MENFVDSTNEYCELVYHTIHRATFIAPTDIGFNLIFFSFFFIMKLIKDAVGCEKIEFSFLDVHKNHENMSRMWCCWWCICVWEADWITTNSFIDTEGFKLLTKFGPPTFRAIFAQFPSQFHFLLQQKFKFSYYEPVICVMVYPRKI